MAVVEKLSIFNHPRSYRAHLNPTRRSVVTCEELRAEQRLMF
jgi:hypothetical protein